MYKGEICRSGAQSCSTLWDPMDCSNNFQKQVFSERCAPHSQRERGKHENRVREMRWAPPKASDAGASALCPRGREGGPLTSTPAWLGENLSGNLGPCPGRNPGWGLTRGGQGWDNVSHLEMQMSLGAPSPVPHPLPPGWPPSLSLCPSIFPSAPSCSLGPRAPTPLPPFTPESRLLTSTQACQAGVQCEQIWPQELAFITPCHLHNSPRCPDTAWHRVAAPLYLLSERMVLLWQFDTINPVFFLRKKFFWPCHTAVWDFSSLTKDWTCASCTGSSESEPQDHQTSP